MGRMQAIAAAWTYTGEYRDVDTELTNFDAVSLKDIRAYLGAYPIDKSTVVAFGPLAELNGVRGQPVEKVEPEPKPKAKVTAKSKPKAKAKPKVKPKAKAKPA